MKLVRWFARLGRKPLTDLKAKLQSAPRSLPRDGDFLEDAPSKGGKTGPADTPLDSEIEEMADRAADKINRATKAEDRDGRELTAHSISLTQSDKIRELSRMSSFSELEDADTQARTRYMQEQRRFSKELTQTEENSHPDKLVQRMKKETLWGLGGELLRRKESRMGP